MIHGAFSVILTAFLFLVGCAPKIQLHSPETVAHVWSAQHPQERKDERITAHFSLQVETKERTGRLVGQLWGFSSSVLRLDLASGTGASVAMIRETPELWTAYIPSENKAYRHANAQVGLALFQIPVPFNSKQISNLIIGNLDAVLGQTYTSVHGTRDGRIRFNFAAGDISAVEASEDLESLVLHGQKGWTLVCEKPYESQAFAGHRLFEKFTFSSPEEGKAVLRVKSLEPGGEWQFSDLDLNLPHDVQWMRIISGPHYN